MMFLFRTFVFLAAFLSVSTAHASQAVTAASSPVTATTASVAATAPSETTAPASLATDAVETTQESEPAPADDSALADVSDFGALDLEALLDTKVETASKKSQSISRAPAIIDVLTREQLYDLGARSLYQSLTFLPGIEVIENYSGTTTLIFRGILQEQYSVKLLLLVNGHPVYEPITSQFLLENIPIEAIDRLEVIRGPGSVLYGTNAFAGVINVITENADEGDLLSLFRLKGGSFNTISGGAGNAGRVGDFSWAVFAAGQKTDGYPYVVEKEQNEDCIAKSPSGLPESVRPLDECTGEGPSGTIDYYNDYVNVFGDVSYKGLRLQAGGVVQEKMKYGLLPNLRFNRPNYYNHYFADASYRHSFSDSFEILARVGLNHDELEWGMGRFPLPDFQETFGRGLSDIYRGELTSSWSVIEELTLDLGVSADYVQLDSYTFEFEDGRLHPLAPAFIDYEQSTYSAYAQASWDIMPELTAIGGHRVSRFQTSRTDVIVDTETTVLSADEVKDDPVLIQSPRAALVYVPKDELAFKLLYGEAFRLPNLFETAGTLNQLIIPSANIQPERIRTWEAGVDARPVEWLNVRAAAYYSQLRDLILRRVSISDREFLELGGSEIGGVYDNVLQGEVAGVELSTRGVVTEQLRFFANVSVKDESYEDIDPEAGVSHGPEPLAGFAPVTANFGLSWNPIDWLTWHPNSQYIGSRGKSKAYVLVNSVLDFDVWEGVTLSAIANNITDVDYTYPEQVRRHVPNIPGGPGRAFYGRVTAEF